MKTDFGSHRSPSELLAFAKFFGCALLVSVILHQLVRAIAPDTLFVEHQRSFGLLAFLIAAFICAWGFEIFSRRRHR